MQNGRLLFLLLAAAPCVIAIGACSSKKSTEASPEDEAGIFVKADDSGTTSVLDTGIPADDSGVITDSGAATGDGSSDASSADSGPVCLGDTPQVDGGAACPPGGACTGDCARFTKDFKKGIAQEINKCLTTAICQGNTTATCVDKALAKACADPTATTFCTPNVKNCKDPVMGNPADTITQANCEAFTKGLTAAGRTELQNCFNTEFVCGDCYAAQK